MATEWVICGAGKGVGKTHLALALCQALPQSVYAKRGSSEPKPGKPENYFRTEEDLSRFVAEQSAQCEHMIVESNGWATQSRGDIIIFVAGTPKKSPRDDIDLIRANAHIRIEQESSPCEWEQALSGPSLSNETQRAVRDVLLAQRAFVCGVT